MRKTLQFVILVMSIFSLLISGCGAKNRAGEVKDNLIETTETESTKTEGTTIETELPKENMAETSDEIIPTENDPLLTQGDTDDKNSYVPQSPTTKPSTTNPPATEPPAIKPSATEPPVTVPPTTEPPATEPPVTVPPATEPPATEPPATELPPKQPNEFEDIDNGAGWG